MHFVSGCTTAKIKTPIKNAPSRFAEPVYASTKGNLVTDHE